MKFQIEQVYLDGLICPRLRKHAQESTEYTAYRWIEFTSGPFREDGQTYHDRETNRREIIFFRDRDGKLNTWNCEPHTEYLDTEPDPVEFACEHFKDINSEMVGMDWTGAPEYELEHCEDEQTWVLNILTLWLQDLAFDLMHDSEEKDSEDKP